MAKKNPFLVPARRKKPKKAHPKPTETPLSGPSVSDINSQVIAEAKANALAQPVPMKLCRLCETKDGPFLNIFEAEQTIAKKIDTLLPFTISEYDDLPHKICFRCSAKVEELHDFVDRCTRAQENLRLLLGKKPSAPPKSNTRKLWEEKLNKSNISNEDICNAVIQKAMEGIKNLPLNALPLDGIPNRNIARKPLKVFDEDDGREDSDDSESEVLRPAKSEEKTVVTRATRQTNSEASAESQKFDSLANLSGVTVNKRVTKATKVPGKDTPRAARRNEETKHIELSSDIEEEAAYQDGSDSDESVNIPIKSVREQKQEPEAKKTETKSKPFNIMDHVSIIKVNGVGVLFQCKLCNRNFLKKDVVETHGCSKTGVPKPDFVTPVVNVEPPKNPMASVKYINNKANIEPPKKVPEPVDTLPAPEVKPKPKIGPASRVKKGSSEASSFVGMKVKPRAATPPPTPVTPEPTPPPRPPQTAPSIEVPAIPGMKSRYRLVPGPNNTFTLVEEPLPDQPEEPAAKLKRPTTEQQQRSDVEPKNIPIPKKIKITKNTNATLRPVTLTSTIIDIEDEPVADAPYPVGFFTSPTKAPAPAANKPESHAPVTFTTPAMKKQSYTVVQTGNPSKLLISAKPRPQPADETTRAYKGKRRTRNEEKTEREKSKEPYSVTIEDTAPPKDAFFTFISLDPLLQPSYVLPTEDIIQESQISTSTCSIAGSSKSKDTYECSLCPEKFSREKKMLAHLQNHYNKMDEDNDEIVRPSKKRTRKS